MRFDREINPLTLDPQTVQLITPMGISVPYYDFRPAGGFKSLEGHCEHRLAHCGPQHNFVPINGQLHLVSSIRFC
jgi:hypothetical protein